MDVDEAVSVSKGVFVFKNGFKPSSKKWKTDETSTFSSSLWYQAYLSVWSDVEKYLKLLNSKLFKEVLANLVDFTKTCREEDCTRSIPTAILLTGINMPDHETQFAALLEQIKSDVTEHVVTLHSQDCQNIKLLYEKLIGQFVNKKNLFEIESDETISYKKNQLDMELLQCWYDNLEEKTPLVVIVPDFASFNPPILQKFIQITSWYSESLPFVFIFGIATSIDVLHAYLPHNVLSKLHLKKFNSQPSLTHLNNVLNDVFLTGLCPFLLGSKVFNLLQDIFLFYDLSVMNFIQNMKFAAFEHFSYGNCMALCNLEKRAVYDVIRDFNSDDLENVRSLESFRKFVESCYPKKQIELLENDVYLKNVLKIEIVKLQKYIRRLIFFCKSLHILINDLPGSPMGKYVKDIYSLTVKTDLKDTAEYKNCFQLLNYLSKDELRLKLVNLQNYFDRSIGKSSSEELSLILKKIEEFLSELDNLKLEENDLSQEEIHVDNTPTTSRKQFKEKLQSFNKQSTTILNKYEILRKNILEYLSEKFAKFLISPKSFVFYEIFFFDDISIKKQITGMLRTAIHTSLNDPYRYLQCKCCKISNTGAILPTMPDISIAYKLHLECGKMINLYDWLQAFLAIVNPQANDDDSSKLIVDPQLQARFTQAVAELEYLGFIKSSKRKADHVMRLTWGN